MENLLGEIGKHPGSTRSIQRRSLRDWRWLLERFANGRAG